MDYRNKNHARADEIRQMLKDHPDMHELISQSLKQAEKRAQQSDDMFAHLDQVGVGATFKNRIGQFALVLPDATHPGQYRYQLFDSKGFIGHATRPSLDQLVYELCDDGFCEVAPTDTLTLLSQQREWVIGTQRLALRSAVQDGLLSWEEAEARALALEQQYPAANAA